MSIRDDAGPVSDTEVMRYWLGEEADGDLDPGEIGTEPALRQELLDRNDIAERVFGAEVAEWYLTDLTAEELRNLRVVVGPHDEDWRALTEDNRIESVAERIHEADDVAALDDETPKDLREVVEFADEIADGNHRAAAYVLYLLRGGEFDGQEAYLGVRE